ncbi:cysteine protease 8 [Tritrichomonas foetus]|uniref:Cysteine protease 8 n=4 Tax=Tritrichomonas TaxID=5723 RepID=A0A1J4KS44_9EUKA|nr:cysteine protease 8 [Tritrichomonas foetus]|eukprot:OHT13704.1 cysteine protease 8 [Tritrichomonas foetus]
MFSFFAAFSSAAALYQLHEQKAFLGWMRSTNQFYTGDEYQVRFGIYLSNKRFVESHNANPANSYKVTLNNFAALTPSEYKSLLGYKPAFNRNSQHAKITKAQKTNTESVDWREKGVVNDVRNQYMCGSCWAFSAIQAIESVYAIGTGTLLSLSEQNLVDCVDTCEGCNGGLMDAAYDYVIEKQNGQFNTEASYWYIGIDETCMFDKYEKAGSISGYYNVAASSEDDLAAKVEQYGPAAVAIDASAVGFQLYWGGIYDNSGCSSVMLDHGVGCVGFGVEGGTQYWIVRNSWGSWWGESGYIRMIRKDNQCGIATMSCIPIA